MQENSLPLPPQPACPGFSGTSAAVRQVQEGGTRDLEVQILDHQFGEDSPTVMTRLTRAASSAAMECSSDQ
jgi:hypothetical protein